MSQEDKSEWEVSYCIPRFKIVIGRQNAFNLAERLKKDGCVSVGIKARDNKRKGGGIRNRPIGIKNKRR